ncbi:MAG: YgiT-type zinc finger protein [Anaerolineales bacterium]
MPVTEGNSMDDQSHAVETCPECQVGTLQPQAVPYFAYLDGRLITVPDFPAWVCDVCHHCEYDEAALDDLQSVLGPKATLPEDSNRRRRLTQDEFPSQLIHLHRGRPA